MSCPRRQTLGSPVPTTKPQSTGQRMLVSEQCCPICPCPHHCTQKDSHWHHGAGFRINEWGCTPSWGQGLEHKSTQNFSCLYYCHHHSHYLCAHWESWNGEVPDHHWLVWVLCLPSSWAHPWLGNELPGCRSWVSPGAWGASVLSEQGGKDGSPKRSPGQVPTAGWCWVTPINTCPVHVPFKGMPPVGRAGLGWGGEAGIPVTWGHRAWGGVCW